MLRPEILAYYQRGNESHRLAAREEFFPDETPTGVLLEMLRRVEDDPGLLAASPHVLTIARPARPGVS
jgi:hypothetical protein